MKELEITVDPRVEHIVNSYPNHAQKRFHEIRKIIIDITTKHPDISRLEETLKWGEPSYITPIGSTLRMDWKAKRSNEFAIFFKCTSRLVPTFKVIFPTEFNYEDHRAIWFRKEDNIPTKSLRSCIQAALAYHKIKKLPDLGIRS